MPQRAIVIGIGSGGILLVNGGRGLRLPAAEFQAGVNPLEEINKVLAIEGFIPQRCVRLGDPSEDTTYFAEIKRVGVEATPDGWLCCGKDPVTRCAGSRRPIAQSKITRST